MQATRFYSVLLMTFLFSTTVSAQVFESGPSDPSQFTFVDNTLLNDLGFLPSLGGAGQTLQVNFSDGALGSGQIISLGAGVEVNVTGGTIGGVLLAEQGSEVNVSGGAVSIVAGEAGSQVNVTGGILNVVGTSSEANISGGTINRLQTGNDGVANVTGGTVSLLQSTGGQVNLFGSDFAFEGVSLEDLVLGEAITVNSRDVELTGLFDDGTAFSFDLNQDADSGTSYLRSGTTLTLTLTSVAVPEPTTTAILLLGCGLFGMRRMRSAS